MLKFTVISLLFGLASCSLHSKEDCIKGKDGYCLAKNDYEEDDDDGPLFYEEDEIVKKRESLFQWDPVKVGHEREIEIAEGQTVKMVTAALRPKLFIIDDFLTSEECDHIIEKAKFFGLESSGLHIDENTKKSKVYGYGQARSAFGDFHKYDSDHDGKITMAELIDLSRRNLKLYINSTDVKTMFEVLNIKEFDDEVFTKEEFKILNTMGITEYLNDLKEKNPRFRDRYSEQVWLKQGEKADDVMKGLREKIKKLTKLPSYLVEGGEPLQVVRYEPFGHYHAHFDGQSATEFPHYKCCHIDIESQPLKCRLCRFITVVYYLNNVEEGGETAFPVADQPNYNHNEFRKRKKEDLYNLSKFCQNATVVVKPKKGRAVMWYNHFIDNKGWLGAMDYYSLHGGCDILKGVKWLANNWLTAPPVDAAHLDSLYMIHDPEGAY